MQGFTVGITSISYSRMWATEMRPTLHVRGVVVGDGVMLWEGYDILVAWATRVHLLIKRQQSLFSTGCCCVVSP